jgi:hypothetical protein
VKVGLFGETTTAFGLFFSVARSITHQPSGLLQFDNTDRLQWFRRPAAAVPMRTGNVWFPHRPGHSLQTLQAQTFTRRRPRRVWMYQHRRR